VRDTKPRLGDVDCTVKHVCNSFIHNVDQSSDKSCVMLLLPPNVAIHTDILYVHKDQRSKLRVVCVYDSMGSIRKQ